jgi:predicted CopG family antitoxin
MWTYFHVVVSMVKKTIDIPEDLYRKINEYRKMFDDIPSFTQAIIRLIKEGLKSEGIAVEE